MAKFSDYKPASGSDWLNLEDGENKLHIVSDYEAYGRHYDKDNESYLTCIGQDKGCTMCIEAEEFVEKIREAKTNQSPNENEKKELEELIKKYNAKRSKVQFLVWVIDRSDAKVKMLRYGAMIQKQISELSKSEEYGFDDLPKYDLTITKSGKGLETEYGVMPARQDSPLTQEEKNAVTDKVKPVKEIIDAMKNKVQNPDKKEDKEKKEIDVDSLPM